MRPTLMIAALAATLVAVPAAPAQDPSPGGPPAKAASYEDVLRMVSAGKYPRDILDACDTVFTFSPDQVAALKKAGAPPALIDALQKKRMELDDVLNVVLILDCSGSMVDRMPDGQTKMDVAKKVVSDLIEAIPTGRNLCFVVYGHNAQLKCEAVQVVRPLGPLQPADKASLKQFVGTLKPVGHTPIARSLRTAGDVLAKADGLSQVVLITDGQETCGGKPAEEAQRLALRENVRAVEVVGFGVTDKERDAVVDIAREGRGRYYDTKNPKELRTALAKAVPGVPTLEPEDGFVPLFNGKDLDGWEVEGGDPRAWAVDRGELAFTNRGDATRNWLFTRKEYADFVLRLDFQLTRGANSGVCFRYKPGDPSPFYPHIQILDDRNPGAAERNRGDRQTGALHDFVRDRPADLKPLAEWNAMEVRVEGRRVAVTVNGAETVATDMDRFADRAARYPGMGRKAGRIGLENWAGSVRFRNIRIKELSARGGPPRSTFDTGAEGWTVFGDANTEPTYHPDGGNPGGYVSAKDGQAGDTWYWAAPAKFLGDRSAAYGKVLGFDLKQSDADSQYDDPDVVLVSGKTRLVFDTPKNPGEEWTRYAVPLRAGAGWRKDKLDGPEATAEEIRQVLGNLTGVLIRGEFREGPDVGSLDNVVLGADPEERPAGPVKKPLPADLPNAVRNLIESLSDEDARVRATAAEALGRFKEPAAVDALCDALTDKDGRVRRAAADSLGKNGEKSDAAADALARRVADEVWVPYPTESFRYDPNDPPPYDGRGKGWGSKDHALVALRKIAPDKVAPALAAALKAKNVEVRRWAAVEMGGQKGEAAVAGLAAALADPDPQVRRKAADGLGRIGDKSDVAVDALVKRVGDDAWVARPKETIWFDPEDPPAFDDHKDWGSKHHALEALRKLAPDRAEEALTVALRSKNPEVRKWAARELAREKGKGS